MNPNLMEEKVYYKKNIPYSITLNPIDKYQFMGKIERLKRFRNLVYEQFVSNWCEYELYIEISEPRGFKTQGYSGPRLHIHGTIIFRKNKEILDFLLDKYYRLLRWTSVDIDTISDKTKWKEYCIKQNIIKNNRISNYTK